MTPVRFVLLALLFAGGIAAAVASVEAANRIREIDAFLAEVDEQLAVHIAAGGGTAVDGDEDGTTLETLKMNNLAWRAELVMRLWMLRIGGGVLALVALIAGITLALRRPPRRRRRRRRRPRPRPGR